VTVVVRRRHFRCIDREGRVGAGPASAGRHRSRHAPAADEDQRHGAPEQDPEDDSLADSGHGVRDAGGHHHEPEPADAGHADMRHIDGVGRDRDGGARIERGVPGCIDLRLHEAGGDDQATDQSHANEQEERFHTILLCSIVLVH